MELMDNFPQDNEKRVTKLKLWFIFVIVLIFLLIFAAVAIWIYSQNLNKSQFKFYIDGKYQSQYDSNIFVSEGDQIYVSIKGIAPLLGYKAYNGGYGQYTEDTTKCYVSNNKEISSFEANSNKIFKYNALDNEDSQSQTFVINQPIKAVGSGLYISLEGLSRAFNIAYSNDTTNNSLIIYTLPNLVSTYAGQITNSAITPDTSDFSEKVLFNNQKAVLYGYIIIKENESSQYGVAKIEEPTNPIIGTKYTSIEFVEGNNDFIVKTSDGKMGIISSDGVTKVKLEYDDIKEIDKNLGLYLVTSNNRQGVVNRNGKIIVYQEYNQIGLPNTINDNNVTNKYILYDNSIPVQRNNLWGLIDINGNTILPLEYNGFGCNAGTNNDSRYSSVLLIPDIQGIVVEKDEQVDNATIKKYGIVKYDGTPMINIVLDSVYSITEQGKTTYYATVANQVINIVDTVHDLQTGQSDGRIEDTSNQNKGENQTNTNQVNTNSNMINNNMINETNNVNNVNNVNNANSLNADMLNQANIQNNVSM